jgi:hypothetical protein
MAFLEDSLACLLLRNNSNDGVQGTLLVIGRPAPLNTGMWLGGDMVVQYLHQPRFANTRLATDTSIG